MTGATDATRPVYNMGSQSNLVGLANNQTFSRKSGNTGALPTSAYALLGSYSASNLYYKLNPSSDERILHFQITQIATSIKVVFMVGLVDTILINGVQLQIKL